ncbi:general substrate transporter [Meredithblackwellia eburnea MCA 4105]
MSMVLYGWDAGVIGGIISTPQFLSQMKGIGYPEKINNELLTFIAAGILLGDIFGCLGSSPFVWTLGRRRTIILACWTAIAGIILQTAAVNAYMMLIGRIVLGLGNGIISAIVPAFVQECAVGAPDKRAIDTVIMIGFGVAGISISNWFDYGMYRSGNHNAWRVPVALQALWLIISVIILHGVPDGPRELYARGRLEEADDSLSRVTGLELTDPDFLAQKEEILAGVKLEQDQADGVSMWQTLFNDKSETRVGLRIWLSIAVSLGAPLFGGNLIVFYSSSIFAHIGSLSTDNITILTASLNTCAPLGMCFGVYALKRFGRRPMLIWGGFGQVTFMVIFTILTNLGGKTSAATNWAAVAMLFCYMTINGAAWIWLCYLYAPEIVPTRYRGQVASIGNALFWTITFVEVYAGPIALANPSVGTKIFIPWKSFIVWFCLTGLSLEQVDLLWASDEFIARSQAAQIIEHIQVGKQSSHDEKA